MSSRTVVSVVLLGLLALVPGAAMAADQGQDLTEMLASTAAVHATAVSGPVISVSPLSFDFGIVNVGTTAQMDVQICNTGNVFLNVSSITFSDPAYSFPVAAGGLSPGVCSFPGNLKVAFHPTDGLAHPATMTIMSDALNGTQVVPLNGQGNAPPVLASIGNKAISAFSMLAFTVSATDADDTVDDVLTFAMTSNLPPSATFDTGSGAFSWTPAATDAGQYSATFTVSDSRLTDSETIAITVTVTNRPPVANAGGTYFGATGRPVQFKGSGSSDPDVGQILTYSWAFGDGGLGSGANPQHTYTIPGNFVASLTVCDNGSPVLCTSDVAAVTIQTEVGAQIILKNNGNILDAFNAAGLQELAIEEVLLPYTDLVLPSLKLTTTFTPPGKVTECLADSRSFKFSDKDADGVTDFSMSFTSKCVKNLLKKVPTLTQAEIVISGLFSSGGGTTPLRAVRTVTVRSQELPLPSAPFAYPNPFNPETSISYSVVGNASVSIRIYSVDGRLVRTLRDNESQTTGSYEVRWNGTNEQGNHMPSGIYFVKTSQKVGGAEQSAVLKLALTK